MKDPTRWLDDAGAPEDVRSMLRAAPRAPRLTPNVNAHLHQVAAEIGKHAAGSALSAGVAAKLGLGTAFLAIASAGTAALVSRSSPSDLVGPAPALHASAPTANQDADETRLKALGDSVRVHGRSPKPEQLATAEKTRATGEPSTAQARDSIHRRPPASRAPDAAVRGEGHSKSGALSGPSVQSLEDEAALIEQARGALVDAPRRALELTRRHQREFRTPRLAAEREVVAIEALVRLGQREAANQRARALTIDADSIYARRVEQLLHASGPGEPPEHR